METRPCASYEEMLKSRPVQQAANISVYDPELFDGRSRDEVLSNIALFRKVIARLQKPENSDMLDLIFEDSDSPALIANAENLVMTHQVESTITEDDYTTHKLLKCLHEALGLTDITAEEIAKIEAAAAKITPSVKNDFEEIDYSGLNLMQYFESQGGAEFAIAYIANSHIEQGKYGVPPDLATILDKAYGANPAYQEMKAICEKYIDLKVLIAGLEFKFSSSPLNETKGRVHLDRFRKSLSPEQSTRLQTIAEYLRSKNYVFAQDIKFPTVRIDESGTRSYSTSCRPAWQKAKVI